MAGVGQTRPDPGFFSIPNGEIVKDRVVPYLNIDVTTTRKMLFSRVFFVKNSGIENRVAERIRQNRGVKSVMGLLKMKEEK